MQAEPSPGAQQLPVALAGSSAPARLRSTALHSAAPSWPNRLAGGAEWLSSPPPPSGAATKAGSVPLRQVQAAILATPLPSTRPPPSSVQPYREDQGLRAKLIQLVNSEISITFLCAC